MNRLWDAGIRPVGAAGSVGQVGAMQEHLKDLREQTRLLVEIMKMERRTKEEG